MIIYHDLLRRYLQDAIHFGIICHRSKYWLASCIPSFFGSPQKTSSDAKPGASLQTCGFKIIAGLTKIKTITWSLGFNCWNGSWVCHVVVSCWLGFMKPFSEAMPGYSGMTSWDLLLLLFRESQIVTACKRGIYVIYKKGVNVSASLYVVPDLDIPLEGHVRWQAGSSGVFFFPKAFSGGLTLLTGNESKFELCRLFGQNGVA